MASIDSVAALRIEGGRWLLHQPAAGQQCASAPMRHQRGMQVRAALLARDLVDIVLPVSVDRLVVWIDPHMSGALVNAKSERMFAAANHMFLERNFRFSA